MNKKRPTLIMIGGSPWVGKTTCSQMLFDQLDNCAWLDGDDVWRVNPFSVEDPRLRNSDANMSFVLQTYLNSAFDYVIFSSVVLTIPSITEGILDRICAPQYNIVLFMLVCSQAELQLRSFKRDGVKACETFYDEAARSRNAILVDTTGEIPADIAAKLKRMVQDPSAAGVAVEQRNGTAHGGAASRS